MIDNKMNMTTGYLELIVGPMFSGKTSRLVEIYKQCLFCNMSVIAINHSIDTRYDDFLLATHDKVKIPCIQTDTLMSLDNINQYDVILINEGQFFTDLEAFVTNKLNDNKQIYVCGLDGDFKRHKFGHILDLIPLCDKITKLSSLCGICKNGTPAIFSKRLSNDEEQTIVGVDNYVPVCRKCFQ